MYIKLVERVTFLLLVALIITSCSQQESSDNKIVTDHDPLLSWNEGTIKQNIISFVKQVVDEKSTAFVKPTDRIAVFDNDGTLWIEKPLYTPVEYELAYLKEVVPQNPELQKNKFYTELAKGNLSVMKGLSSFELINLLFAIHDGQKETDYENSVYTFLSENNHPKFKRPFKTLVYQPMVELVTYLQQNNFNVYIVTGGEISFVRTVSKEIYNIEPENVIGSSVQLKYVSDTTGTYLMRRGEIQSINDQYFKPSNIGLHIGKKPIFAAGNSDGDYEMMEYTLSGKGPSMAIIVNHDDTNREYKYMHGTEKAISHADSIGWQIVSMKKDFSLVFPPE